MLKICAVLNIELSEGSEFFADMVFANMFACTQHVFCPWALKCDGLHLNEKQKY